MLKNLVESKLFTNFLIIEDKEDLSCQNLFVSLLKNYQWDGSDKNINLICYENPPDFYLSCRNSENGKIISHNYFSHPLNWNNPSIPATDLSFFLSTPKNLSETIFFIDSVSALIYYHGFYKAYKNLCALKKLCKQVICIAHGDLFKPKQLEELFFLSTTYIELQECLSEKSGEEIVCEITYLKPGGKVIRQKEIFCVNDNFKITSKIQKTEVPILSKVKRDIESLTTFKLSLFMSEEEKRARDKLILPYVKTHVESKRGEFVHQFKAQEFEDDLDDDLEI